MSGDVRDVGVLPVAELPMAIAADLRLGLDVGGSSSELVDDVEHRVDEHVKDQKSHYRVINDKVHINLSVAYPHLPTRVKTRIYCKV